MDGQIGRTPQAGELVAGGDGGMLSWMVAKVAVGGGIRARLQVQALCN